jgi:ankyrin repeat protein
MTELHYAAYCGDVNALRQAIAAGQDVNAPDTYRGYAPLHWLTDMAATGGPRLEMLEILVRSGADVDKPALDGTTPLALATQAGSVTGDELAAALTALGAKRRS